MSRTTLLSVSMVVVLAGCFGKRERPDPGPSSTLPGYGGGSSSTGGAGTGAGSSTGGASAGGATGTGGAATTLTACACAVNIESLAIVNCNLCVDDNTSMIPASCQTEDDACVLDGACDDVRQLIANSCTTPSCVTTVANSLLDAAGLQKLEAYYNCLCSPALCGGSCDPAPSSCEITIK